MITDFGNLPNASIMTHREAAVSAVTLSSEHIQHRTNPARQLTLGALTLCPLAMGAQHHTIMHPLLPYTLRVVTHP